jgi:alanyl-tRNA synthetase
LRREPGVVAVLATFDGAKISMVTASADGTEVDARELLNNHLAPFGGRGGGSPNLAQGGGELDEKALDNLFLNTSIYSGLHKK